MKVRTSALAPAQNMAATFILLMHHDKWRWNQNTGYTVRAAISFWLETHKQILRSKTATTDNMRDGLIVYTFPDGSRIGVIKKDKTCWEIGASGDKVVAAEKVQ